MPVPPTPEAAREYLRSRFEFTSAVGRMLVDGIGSNGDPHVVYGVWLSGHACPIYIGQSANGRRRLWDLPIGESHHLANSFPPESWDRVVVVQWRELARDYSADCRSGVDRLRREPEAEDTPDSVHAVGLALEYMLQIQYAPVFNESKKARDGTWKKVQLTRSRSRGALIAGEVGAVYDRVHAVWLKAAKAASDGRASIRVGRHGYAVFPQIVRASTRAGA